jgi:hypothetical protein
MNKITRNVCDLVYRRQINNDINYFMREPVLADLEKSSMVSDENMYKQRNRILQFQEEPDERYQDLMLPKIRITRAVSQTLSADRMPLEFKHDKNIIRYGQTLVYSADGSDNDSDNFYLAIIVPRILLSTPRRLSLGKG